jgi:signal transduction histidine kinase
MHRRRTYLQTLPARLVLFIAAPVLVSIAVAGMLVMGALERQFERRMQEDVEMVARALQKPVSHALERQREGSLRSALESALDIGRVYGVYLYNQHGSLLAYLGSAEDSRRPERAARLRHRARGGGHYASIQGEPVYSYYVPVRLGGDRGTGLLAIARRKADIDEFMSRLRAGGAALLLMLAVLMTAILFVGYRRAAGLAFRRLHESIDRIRAGDRAHRPAVRGPYEVRGVVAGLNAMLDSIESAEEHLARSREERLELNVRLGASERLAAIGELAAGIAHELGAPLGTAVGRIQRVMRREDLPATMEPELRDVASAVNRMSRLVQEVLAFGRREGLRRSRLAPSELVGAVRNTLLAHEAAGEVERVEIRGCEEPMLLEVDPSRLEQALVNLIRNAMQASPGGDIRVDWHPVGESICFVIEDDGPGVSPEHRKRIFDPFFSTRGDEGTGLGLAIVAAVAHEHGGEIAVATSELGGARFELTVPIRSDAGEPHGKVDVRDT